ncbi:MAG: NAD(P)/FAD-dependent oxidoreductase [Muribaculaceae bacterium]|nr:NAD(P)/FAD-dependent oxidoreductase [Muribaculaceae bacterium]MDE5968268.1 NAD(P)/FAD-dependent oxidoreductase [Muribaculaceae bacterium]
MNDVVIIGGGLGGLFTGALLARNGKKVTVVEKNQIIGGGLQCFTRRGKSFETGMHIIGGFEPGGNLDHICRYLNIRHRLTIKDVDSDCIDEITYGTTGRKFRMAAGRRNFTDRLIEYFPAEAAGIEAYIEEIYNLANEVDLFYLRPSEGIPAHSDNFFRPADELIASFVSDPQLRELLAYLNPLYSGIEGSTPAYVHSLINVLYIEGSARFVGGSQQLADLLAEVITSAGGQVINNTEVTAVEVNSEGEATGVVTADGQRHEGKFIVSSIHPEALFPLLPPKSFTKAYVNRLSALPKSASAFSLFIDLKPDRLPFINHTCYYIDSPGLMWGQQSVDVDDQWPRGFMYMTPPDAIDQRYASRLLVHCIIDYSHFIQWADSTVGCRPEGYLKFKQYLTDLTLAKLEKALPGVNSMIAHVYAASPLTIRDYYHTPEGAIFGYRKDCDSLMASQIPVWTKVKNLLLTGQNLNLHGICGVPLTAITTAEAILGYPLLPDM